jgi:MFS superfamily sulfate permease-like transporter
MRTTHPTGVLSNLRFDAPAGLVVFLVALPLCLGIALASDAPLFSGIVAGVVGGLVVAPLSGSSLSVSGPAAGLTALCAASIADLGSFEVFLTAVALSGLFQLGFGALRAGVLANVFPISVIKGMLAGIGLILILKQIPHALGRDADYEGDESFWMLGHQSNTVSEISAALDAPLPGVVGVAAVCLAVLLVWERFVARTAAGVVPGPLAAVGVGLALNEALRAFAPGFAVVAPEHLVTLPQSGVTALWRGLPSPDLGAVGRADVWLVAATIAVIGSIESLLSVEATDKLDPWRRVSNTNRELFAQGAGNVVSGLLGGLPLTAVIVRSSANVQAGGRTRTSSVVHGVLLLGLVLAAPLVLNRIPLAALAAVLLTVGYKLAKVELFRSMYRAGFDQFLPFVVTVTVTVFVDLLSGVLAGLAVGAVLVAFTNYVSAIAVVHEEDRWLVLFTKDVSFLNKTRLRAVLSAIPDGADLVIDGHRAEFIDHDIEEMVHEFAEAAPLRGVRVELLGLESKPFPLRLPGVST